MLVGWGLDNLIGFCTDVLVVVQPGLGEDGDVDSMIFKELICLSSLLGCVEPSDIIS